MRIITFLAASLAFGVGTPAGSKVVSAGETNFVTRDSAAVAASPRATWLALIKPADWWNSDHSWSRDAANLSLVPSAGGCFCEKIPGEGDIPLDGSVQHAVIVQAIPDKALRLRGSLGPLQAVPAAGILTITMKPVDGGTLITWEYHVGGVSGFPMEAISGAVDGVMSEQLHRLRDHLGALELPEEAETAEIP